MVNSWSLLHDELNMDRELEWVKANGGFEYTPMVSQPDDYYKFWEEPEQQSTFSVDMPEDNMPPWGHSDMEALGRKNIELPENTNGFWKYEEDLTMKEVRDYLSGTYRAHYTSQESKTQTLDLIESIGDAEAFCRSNAIKYLSRFGKKNGKSKLDILKAIHYCILLYHFSGLHNAPNNTYETF